MEIFHSLSSSVVRLTIVMFDGKEEKIHWNRVNKCLRAFCEIDYLFLGRIFLLSRLKILTSILVLFYLLKNCFVSSVLFLWSPKK